MRAIGAFLLFLLGKLFARRRHAAQHDPSEREVPADRRPEVLAAGLMFAAGAGGVAFVVLYAVHENTQLLGLALGVGLAFLAAALIVAGKRVVPQETAVEERDELVMPEEEREVPRELARGAEGISRRRLLTGAAGVAGLGLGAAAVVPAASLGPDVDHRPDHTPWRRGRVVVDERGKPILADDVAPESFVTGFPQGADPRELGSPIVMVRVPLSHLRLPEGRRPADWAPEGIVAYSKICTHAGCAIALYRKPRFADTQPRAALICPCHYSTFDPARGAERIFGPAGRALPQLPLAIGPGRRLVAGGGFSGSVGPAWWGTKGGYR
jgi:ubiquinol-cytochrome c reductase iron-sulfur subunit